MRFCNWISFFIAKLLIRTGVRGGTSLSNRQNNTIKLGIIAPFTGDEAFHGQSVLKGIDLAVQNYNVQGGILGKQIDTVVYDSKGTASEAVNAFEKLANVDKVAAVLGGVLSSTALAVAPLAQKYNVPMVTPTATNENVTKGYKSVFRASSTDRYQSEVLAEFAYDKLNARKVSIMYDETNIYSVGVAEAFKNAFEALGGSVVSYEGYTGDTEDFSPFLGNVKAANPDVLFIPDYYNPAVRIAKQVKEAGINKTLLGSNGWEGWESVEGAADVLQGSYYSSRYALEEPTIENKNFITDYKKKYNENPSSRAALGYDSAVMMLEAMRRSASTEPDRIIERLEESHMQGVTGEIKFDREHNPHKPTYMFRIEDGRNILVQKIRPE